MFQYLCTYLTRPSTPTSKDRRDQHSDQQRPKRPALRPAKTEETSTPTSKRPSSTALEKKLDKCTGGGVPRQCQATCVLRNLRLQHLYETRVTKTESEKPAAGTSSKRQSNFLWEPSPLPHTPHPRTHPTPLLPPSPQTVSRLLGSCSGEPKPISIYGLRPMFRTHRFSVSFSCAYFYFFFFFFLICLYEPVNRDFLKTRGGCLIFSPAVFRRMRPPFAGTGSLFCISLEVF